MDAERMKFYANDEIWDHEFCEPDEDCDGGECRVAVHARWDERETKDAADRYAAEYAQDVT